jgi:signal transduction histidine kinase
MKRFSAFLWAALLLLLLISALAAWSISNARATAYNSLRAQGEALAEAIERSALHGFRTEHLLSQQFLESFQTQVEQLDQQLALTKDPKDAERLLREAVQRHHWDRAVIFDKDLRQVMAHPAPGDFPPPGHPPGPPPESPDNDGAPDWGAHMGPGRHMGMGMGMGMGHGRGMGMGPWGMGPAFRIRAFLESSDKTAVLQGPSGRHAWGMEPYLVAHKRSNGEVLLVRSSLERMKEAFNPASVETLFHTLALGKTIMTVVLADDDGTIRFASDDAWVGKPLDGLESKLAATRDEAITVARTLPGTADEPRGRLLLALSTEPAQRHLAQTRKSVALMGLATFTTGMAGLLAIAWMQRRSLRREQQMQQTVTRSKRLAALGQMAGQVAHEIRNPLNAITLTLQNLRRQLQSSADAHPAATWQGYLDTTQDELRRLNRIVENFLGVSRFPPIQRRDVDLNAWLSEAVSLYAGQAQLGGVTLVAPQLQQPLHLTLDPDQMGQAIGNLLLNAIQASPSGSAVQVRLLQDRHGVTIEIEDHGSGIPADDLERVFELYYTTRHDGSGLGLPIALRIIEDHGGMLSLDSRPGQGTTARIFLPQG